MKYSFVQRKGWSTVRNATQSLFNLYAQKEGAAWKIDIGTSYCFSLMFDAMKILSNTLFVITIGVFLYLFWANTFSRTCIFSTSFDPKCDHSSFSVSSCVDRTGMRKNLRLSYDS